MKQSRIFLTTLLITMCIAFGSCQAIGDIFKAGVWVGVLLVAIVIGVIIWLVGKSKK